MKFFIFCVHTPLDHRALRYTVNVVITTKPEVGVERQNSVKMEVFRPWSADAEAVDANAEADARKADANAEADARTRS